MDCEAKKRRIIDFLDIMVEVVGDEGKEAIRLVYTHMDKLDPAAADKLKEGTFTKDLQKKSGLPFTEAYFPERTDRKSLIPLNQLLGVVFKD